MSFPQAVGGTLFHQSDFDLTAYLVALPLLIQSLAIQEQANNWCTTAASVDFASPVGFSGTVATGLCFVAGEPCMVHLTSTPTTVYYSAQIITYDSSTGFLNVSYNGGPASGTGLGAATIIGLGGPSDLSGVDNAFKPEPVLLDRGGLGNALGGTIDGYHTLGIGAPTFHMEEIYEEFNEPLGDNAYNDYYPFTVFTDIANPFTARPLPNSQAPVSIAQAGIDPNDSFYGSLIFNGGGGLASSLPAFNVSFFHGAQPWLSLAPTGGDIYLEFKFASSTISASTPDFYRFGLAGYTSSRTGNVFSRCGMGFLISGGYLYIVYSAYGQTYTQATFAPAVGAQHVCRIEIYRSAGIVAYFVDNVEVCRLSYLNQIVMPAGISLVTDNMTAVVTPLLVKQQAGVSISPVEAIMWPVMAASYQKAVPASQLQIDYMYLRNFIQRYSL